MCEIVCENCGKQETVKDEFKNNKYCRKCYLFLREHGSLPVFNGPDKVSLTENHKDIRHQAILKALIEKKGLKLTKEQIISELDYYSRELDKLL